VVVCSKDKLRASRACASSFIEKKLKRWPTSIEVKVRIVTIFKNFCVVMPKTRDRNLPVKIVVAIPHIKPDGEFDMLTTWSVGVFRRLGDRVKLKITNRSEFIANFAGNDYYDCIIFTLDEESVFEINSYFKLQKFKPIIKNCENVVLLNQLISNFRNIYSDKVICQDIFTLTKNISFLLQNNMKKNIRDF